MVIDGSAPRPTRRDLSTRRARREKKSARSDRHRLSPDPEGDIATDMRSSRSQSAIENWVTALNARGAGARTCIEAAAHPDIEVERFGFGVNKGRAVETIRGLEGVAAWFATTPDIIDFELDGSVSVESEFSVVGYKVIAGDFENGGTWRFKLHEDGRIAWLEHRPNEVEEAVEEGSFRLGRADAHGATPGGHPAHYHHGHHEHFEGSMGHPHHHGEHHHDH